MWGEFCNTYSPDAERENMREYKIYYDCKVGWICEVNNGFGCRCIGQGKTPQEALQDGIKGNKGELK